MITRLILAAALVLMTAAAVSYVEGWTVPGTGSDERISFACPPTRGCDV